MRFKRIFLLTCILMCLFAMASVCAGEANDTKLASETADDDLTNQEILQLSDECNIENECNNQAMELPNQDLSGTNDEILGDVDDGSFNALKSKIENAPDGANISLENDYYFDDTAKSNSITISKSITIYGNGHTIDAQGTGRIFHISTESVNLYDITFKNGQSDYGGAIYIEGSFSGNLTGNFINNHATEGGAIYILNNCSGSLSGHFINNSATMGGAIIIGDDVSGNLSGYFANNTSQSGGAIYIYGLLSGNLTGYFINNSNGLGGAIFVEEVSGILSGTFINNTAIVGGAIYIAYTCSGILSGLFVNNSAANNGGAIDVQDVSGSVSGSFINNSAGVIGGAIHMNDVSGSVSGSFVNNYALEHGGAIRMGDVLGSVSGSFVNNYALMYAGAVYMGDVLGSVSGSFINNSAAYTGAINMDGLFGSLSGYFVNNKAVEYGGAINMDGLFGSLSGYFVNNTAVEYGGAINMGNLFGNLSGYFVNNVAGKDGGAINMGDLFGNLSGYFVNNAAGEHGSAICIGVYDLGGVVHDSIFINNNGTSIFVYSGENVSVINSWFGNDATNYNIKPKAGNVNMSNWLFLNQKANPTTIPVLATSDISFKLYLYNETSKEITEYDNTRLPPVDLKIAATNGNVDKNIVKLGGTLKFSATNLGIGRVIAIFENKIFTIELNVIQATTKITAASVKTTYNKDKYLTITLTDDKGIPLSGEKITININGVKTYITDKNGQVKVNIAKLIPKTYNVEITFKGTNNFKATQATVKITVQKAKAKIKANKKTYKKSKKVKKYTIALKDNIGKAIKNAKLTLKIGKKTYKAKTNKKGKATFKIKKLNKKGKYKVVIKYTGNKYYNKVTKKVKITIR